MPWEGQQVPPRGMCPCSATSMHPYFFVWVISVCTDNQSAGASQSAEGINVSVPAQQLLTGRRWCINTSVPLPLGEDSSEGCT
jgi:hypothetical protein